MDKEKFIKTTLILILSYKGLNPEEIISITKSTMLELKIYLAIFKIFCFTYKNYWKITNPIFI